MQVIINGEKIQFNEPLIIQDSGKVCFDRKNSRYYIQNNEWKKTSLKKGLNEGHFIVESLNIDIPFNGESKYLF